MRMSSIIGLLLSATALVTTGFAQAKQPPPIVAVFLMESRGSPLSGDELVGLTDYMATKLGEQGRFQIIPRDEIKKRLAEQKQRSYKDCVDQSCQIDIGRELAAQYTVTSSIAKVGRKCLLTAQLYDLRKAATVMTASSKKTCDPDELITGVEEITAQFQKKMKLLEETRARDLAKATPPAPEPKPDPKPKPEPVKTPSDWRPANTQTPEPEPKPEPEPYVSASTVEPASTGWAMGASITGFISAAVVLGLAVGSDLAADSVDCYYNENTFSEECDSDTESIVLGGIATVALGVMGPVVSAGARSPSGQGVYGSVGLRVVGWITYGLGMADAVALLLIGVGDLDVDIPFGVITAVGIMGATSLTMFSIDGLIARSQASRALSAELDLPTPTEGLVWTPNVSPVLALDGRGVDGASFGLSGRF